MPDGGHTCCSSSSIAKSASLCKGLPPTIAKFSILKLLWIKVGAIQKYVRSEVGDWVPKKAYKNVQGGRGGFFKERTYARVIFTK